MSSPGPLHKIRFRAFCLPLINRGNFFQIFSRVRQANGNVGNANGGRSRSRSRNGRAGAAGAQQKQQNRGRSRSRGRARPTGIFF